MFELVYTSTPQGLITGRSGFTTVALTEGFPPNLIAPIENLSGYKTLFPPGDKNENFNPVNFSCQHFQLGRTLYIVLSRISYAGLSYTGRINVLAHHLILTPEELYDIPGGAAAVLLAEENFPEWSGAPRMLPARRKLAHRPLVKNGNMWHNLAGDQRWAEYTVDCFRKNPEKGLALAFDPLLFNGGNVLQLIAETSALLTREELLRFTFSTYSHSSGIANPQFFRGFVNSSVQLASIRRLDRQSVINLGSVNFLPQAWCDRKALEADAGKAGAPEPCDEIKLSREDAVMVFDGGNAPDAAVFSRAPENSGAYDPALNGGNDEVQISPHRKYIIMAVIICLVLGLGAAVYWRISSAGIVTERAEKNDGILDVDDFPESSGKTRVLPERSRPQPEVKPEIPPAVPQKLPPRDEREKNSPPPEVKKTAAKATPSVAVTPEPVSEKLPQKAVEVPPAVKKLPRFGQLGEAEQFKLYHSFYSAKNYTLPAALNLTFALKVKLNSIGGVREISDISRFIEGNNSKKVTVYSKVGDNSGVSMEWNPDKSAARKMVIMLAGDELTFSLPQQMSEDVPQLADIAEITFLSHAGERFSFVPSALPGCIDRILNSQAKSAVQIGNRTIRFVLNVSDEFLAFGKFYSIVVDGRDLGGGVIRQRSVILRELNLQPTVTLILKRQEELNKLRKIMRDEENFKREHKNELVRPRFELSNILQRKFKKNNIALPVFSVNDTSAAYLKKKDKLAEGLNELIAKDKSAAQNISDIDDSLRRFEENCKLYLDGQKKIKKFRKDAELAFQEYEQRNRAVQQNLKNLPGALYEACRNVVENGDKLLPLDPDFYQKIDVDKLQKDIKFEIIRRKRL